MAEQKQTTTGNSNAVPEPRIKWVNIDDAAKLAKYVGRYFVEKNGDKDSIKYRVVSIVAATPADIVAPIDKKQFNFLIQKHDGSGEETIKIPTPSGGSETITRSKTVIGHVMDENGSPICVDKYASFFIDSEEFKRDYAPDTEE